MPDASGGLLYWEMSDSWGGQWNQQPTNIFHDDFRDLDVDALAQQYARQSNQGYHAQPPFPTSSLAPSPGPSHATTSAAAPLMYADAYETSINTNFAGVRQVLPTYSGTYQGVQSSSEVSSADAPMFSSTHSTPQSTYQLPILPSQPYERGTGTSEVPSLGVLKRPRPSTSTNRTEVSPRRYRSPVLLSPSSVIGIEEIRSPDLSEDERLLIELKQEQNMPWKEISREFEERLGRPYHVPALQMRYKRLRERLRHWTNEDVAALEAAHEYWQNNKFEIIAQKMLDFGVQERWPARLVEKKLEQLHPDDILSAAIPIELQQAISIPTPISTIVLETSLESLRQDSRGPPVPRMGRPSGSRHMANEEYRAAWGAGPGAGSLSSAPPPPQGGGRR